MLVVHAAAGKGRRVGRCGRAQFKAEGAIVAVGRGGGGGDIGHDAKQVDVAVDPSHHQLGPVELEVRHPGAALVFMETLK